VELPVPEITFQAGVPPGAESLEPYLGSTQVKLEREIEGDLESLEAGDAIVMKVTATIEGMPAMFLPALIPQTQQPGLAVYPKEPSIEDGQVARRVEAATVLFEGGGEFSLPAIELGWWNVRTKVVEVASLPEIVIAVSGAPVAARQQLADPAGIETPDWRWPVAALILLAVGFAAPRSVRTARSRWRRWIETRLASEPYAFRALMKSIRSQDASQVDVCLLVWLARLNAGTTLERLCVDTGITGPSALAAKMARARYGASGAEFGQQSFAELGRALKSARSASFRLRRREPAPQALAPLNPPG
jgi:hypothetical protein